MILAALALAAALDAAPAVATVATAPTPALGKTIPGRWASSIAPRTTERTPNLYREPAGCRNAPYRVIDRYGRPLAQKLGDLPAGGVILAVERMIGGCQVVVVANGAVAPDRPVPPAWTYRIEPLERFASKREDAPSNRR